MFENGFGLMCIGTEGVGELAQRGHVSPHFQKLGGGGAQTHLCPLLSFTALRYCQYWDLQLTVRLNLHFFYQYTELCMDKSNHN